MAQATGLVITGAIPPAAASAAVDIFAGKPIQRRAEHDWFWCYRNLQWPLFPRASALDLMVA
jgi:hypothetical protein